MSSASSSSELEDTIRIPTQTGLPNLRLTALFALPVLHTCFRSPSTIPVFGALTAAEGLSLLGKNDRALRILEAARQSVHGRRDVAEALVNMAMGRVHAIRDEEDFDVAELELRRAKSILDGLPWSPLQELLLLWTTVILADLLTERDPDVIDENAKELAREAKALLEHCIPFKDPDPDPPNDKKARWRRCKDTVHRKLAWFHFYMWAAVSTTAVFFHTDCSAEGLDLTRRLLDVAHARNGRSWLAIELQFAIGVFLSSSRDYPAALEAYRTARDWHVEKRARTGDANIDPLMNYYIAICLSKLGRDAEARDELAEIDVMHAVLHDECEFHDEEFGYDLLGLSRMTFFRLHQDEDVVQLCERFALVLDEKMGRTHAQTLASMRDHSQALRSLGRLGEAATVLREMLGRILRMDSPPADKLHNTAMQLAHTLHELREYEEAAFQLRKFLERSRPPKPHGQKAAHSKMWPQRRFALVQLARIYNKMGLSGEEETAYAEVQRVLRLAPPTCANVARYFWYRGRMFVMKERYRLAAGMFVRARQAREEELKCDGGWDVTRSKDKETQAAADMTPPTDDECYMAITEAMEAASRNEPPAMDAFAQEDNEPIEMKASRSRYASEDNDDDDEVEGDADADADAHADVDANADAHADAHAGVDTDIDADIDLDGDARTLQYIDDPRIEASIAVDCSIPKFGVLPGSFEQVCPGRKMRGPTFGNRTLQIYA